MNLIANKCIAPINFSNCLILIKNTMHHVLPCSISYVLMLNSFFSQSLHPDHIIVNVIVWLILIQSNIRWQHFTCCFCLTLRITIWMIWVMFPYMGSTFLIEINTEKQLIQYFEQRGWLKSKNIKLLALALCFRN